MGLDSVELVMHIEQYFNIEIAIPDAEKLYTVEDMVRTVARYRNIRQADSGLQQRLFLDISAFINTGQQTDHPLRPTEPIARYFPLHNKALWVQLEQFLKLSVPRPDNYKPANNKWRRWFGSLVAYTPAYQWDAITVAAFANAIAASNYKTLINPTTLSSSYEIYIVVAGITAEKMGIDYFAIAPARSFTNDLGID